MKAENQNNKLGGPLFQNFTEEEQVSKAAAQGNSDAQFSLALMYYKGQELPQDFKVAAQWYRKAAEQGHAGAQFNLAEVLKDGLGVTQDIKEAVQWCRKAAEQGYVDAQFNLAQMLENGRGVQQDVKEAVKWYRKAAEQGYVDAQVNLGLMLNNGEGVKQDSIEATQWLRKAAEQGDVNSQYILADIFETGEGVPQDFEEAARWYRKAAEQGDEDAQCTLADMLKNGEGVPQDFEEAERWYRKAAEQGSARAQNDLALMLEKGEGIPQEFKEAAQRFYIETFDHKEKKEERMVGSFKKKQQDAQKSREQQYIEHTFALGRKTHGSLAQAIHLTTSGDVSMPVNADSHLQVSLAILGASLAVLCGHSTFMPFARGKEIAARCRRVIIDGSLVPLQLREDSAKALDEYQKEFAKGMSHEINPFGQVSGIMLVKCFGSKFQTLCLPGSGNLNPLIHQVAGDILTMTVNEACVFWKEG